MAHLTKQTVEAAKAPANGQRFLRDNDVRGFALRMLASGSKTFVWEGKIHGRTRRITIGQWPDVTVAWARQRALEIRAAVGRGEDPAAAREAERREPTFGDLRARYIEQHAKPHKRSWERDERRLVRCGWDTRRLSDVTTADVLRLKERVARDNGRIEANRVVEVLRAMWNWARRLGLAEENPAADVERYRETRRDRFLSEDELRRLNGALLQEREPWRTYFPLLLLLGMRKGELLGAQWADVDFEAGTLRLARTKNGEPRLAPLPTAAIEMLRNLPSNGNSEWLFPSPGNAKSATGHLVEVKSAWKRICRKAGLADVTIHDLRRTVGSRMAIAGVNLPTIGRVLGHTGLNATQIYARLDIEAARRALEANAASLPLTLASEAGK